MTTPPDDHNREIAEKLCEQWFDTGARASWCPKMVDEFAAALREAEVRVWREAAGESKTYCLYRAEQLEQQSKL